MWHTPWLGTGFTSGVGFTVTVKVIVGPGQPNAAGVTTIVATTGAVPVLVAVNGGILPVPLAAIPILGVVFVHVYVVGTTGPLKVKLPTAVKLQYAAFAIGVTPGVGFTV